ncbi:MAG: class I SAM-dependent methyltransferase [Aquisalimonadaceae bacterium]
MAFQDLFSGHAGDYGDYRPGYPDALFDMLCTLPRQLGIAWDCGAGSGQAALALAERLPWVIATDASLPQLKAMPRANKVARAVCLAEAVPLPDHSVDLVTVAQALHWFGHDAFHAEVHRVLRPGGVLAAWCYGLTRISPAVDAVVDELYVDIVGPYWPPERRHIDAGYTTLPFPYRAVALPGPVPPMSAYWNLQAFAGYLGTWSAVRLYRNARGKDPLDQISDALRAAWGPPEEERMVHWPMNLLAGTVEFVA